MRTHSPEQLRSELNIILNKLFPMGLELALLDGDSRTMRTRIEDLFDKISSHTTHLLLTEILEEIDKFIDENDDGLWSGRETADKIRDILTHKLKQ